MIHYNCRYCEEKVSPRAITCPHCGEPEPAVTKTSSFSKMLRITGVVLITLSIFYWGFDIKIINSHPIFYVVAGLMGGSLLLKSRAKQEVHT
ncbi:MAG: hypothetical protein ACI94Y_002865 [Maribacter sp.]|jgi:hypothetical protein